MKIARVRVNIEFSDDSTTFENFTKVEGAKDWLEAWEMKIEGDKEEERLAAQLGSHKEPDAFTEKESEKGIM